VKNIVVLGSTGSIGRNTLDVIERLGEDYNVVALAAKTNIDLLVEQTNKFRPSRIVLVNAAHPEALRNRLNDSTVEIFTDENALVSLACGEDVDLVVNALVGAIGLRSTLEALAAGKVVAVANKESIVMAGNLVMEAVANSDGLLIPIDSEHSAVLQCLRGESPHEVKHLILTASGGPFLKRPADEFSTITAKEALLHPNWQMGPKITIDSATLMNKGLEVIEAHYLFNLEPEKIKIVIHPQSVVHSFVEFVDGSIKAQLSLPDMRIPIQYAITYPDRLPADYILTDLNRIASLTFEPPDFNRFPCLGLAYDALSRGEGYPTVLNAANEIAVEAFLNGTLSFLQIPELITVSMNEYHPSGRLDLKGILEIDEKTRIWCRNQLKGYPRE
jgi:1-deoxy-D-xylulose-5-phosphate reductoisomerase